MQSYTFKVTPELRALAAHAVANHEWQRECYTGPEWGCDHEKPKEPSLLLVKDQGVYLISCFVAPGAPETARFREGEKLVVIYAEGHDPRKDDDWWVAGDDYGVDIPAAKFILDPIVVELRVEVKARSIKVEGLSLTPPLRKGYGGRN